LKSQGGCGFPAKEREVAWQLLKQVDLSSKHGVGLRRFVDWRFRRVWVVVGPKPITKQAMGFWIGRRAAQSQSAVVPVHFTRIA